MHIITYQQCCYQGRFVASALCAGIDLGYLTCQAQYRPCCLYCLVQTQQNGMLASEQRLWPVPPPLVALYLDQMEDCRVNVEALEWILLGDWVGGLCQLCY